MTPLEQIPLQAEVIVNHQREATSRPHCIFFRSIAIKVDN